MASLSRERLKEAPADTYVQTALEPSYRWMLERYYRPLLKTHIAWAVVLAESKALSKADASQLALVCRRAAEEIPPVLRNFDPHLEYFYSAVEQYLTSEVGELASELNIARTRPEPLARLAVRALLIELLGELSSLRNTVLALGRANLDALMLQWTHFQPAQPSTFGHYFDAISRALGRDWLRIWSALKAVNVSTLGSGALAGSSYPVDRDLAARLLGFDVVLENTLDCVAAMDHMTEVAFAASSTMVTLSRLSQDLYMWHTDEFGLVEIGDGYSGSSSLMPQKKNPYPFEYVRIAAGRSVGDLAAAFSIASKVNYQDTKDVEEGVVEAVVEIIERTLNSISLLKGALSTLKIDRKRAKARAGKGFSTATELAASLHRNNSTLSSRAAHRIVAAAVAIAIEHGRDEVRAEDLTRAAHRLGMAPRISPQAVKGAADAEAFVQAHGGRGGPAGPEVARLLEADRVRLQEDDQLLASFEHDLETADLELESRVAGLAR